MKVITVNNYDEMSHMAAEMLATQIIFKKDSILGLATGDTPLGMYKELIKMYKEGKIDFSGIKTFNLDEYYGLSSTNPQSYHYYMMNNLFNHINVKKENINIPDGTASDVQKECTDYEKRIAASGGVDIQVVGIGVNGHIGFNEPAADFKAETHLVKLNEKTIQSNSRFFNSEDEVPKYAISMGIKTIMQSKNIILLADGISKADAIAKSVKGKIIPSVPASVLQLHNNVTVIIDKAAASKL